MNNQVLAGALSVARRGWYVFPCAGKNPRIKDWPNKASVDEKTVKTWWERWPDSNVGVACGPSGLWVIDVDDDDGRAWVAQADLPATLSVRTGSGGEHYYFQRGDHLLGNTAKRVPGIDTRGDGGFVVVPPSIHPETGQAYEWGPRSRIADVPGRLVEIFGQPREVQRVAAPYVPTQVPDSYGQAALEGECAKVSGAAEGQRNETLNVAAFNLGTVVGAGLLPESVARSDLHAAAMAAGLDETETLKTIDSGMRAGMGKPRQVATRNRQPLRVVGKEERAPVPSPNVVSKVADRFIEQPPWMADLHVAKGGRVAEDAWNIDLILKNSVGVLAHDAFRKQDVLLDQVPWEASGHVSSIPSRYPRQLVDTDVTSIRIHLSQSFGMNVGKNIVYDAVQRVCRTNSFDCLTWYLDGLRWDGVPRLSTAASTYFEAEPVPSDALMRAWMISAVARALEPGCKVDHMLVLEGKQDAGKSTALKILGGEWFRDDVVDIENKDAVIVMSQAWIYEYAELDGISRKEEVTIKAFLTKTDDVFRPPYERATISVPRRFVFAGTTNEAHYLKDATGARRFWPVKVNRVDLWGLAANRDQLWAEAVVAYRDGESWYALDADTRAALLDVRSDRQVEDPWNNVLGPWLKSTTLARVTVKDAAKVIGIEDQNLSVPVQKRIVAVLRANDWGRAVRFHDAAGAKLRGYEPLG